MTWALVLTLCVACFGLGVLFGHFVLSTREVIIAQEPKEETKEKRKAYSPCTDPARIFFQKEFSHFDEVDPRESLDNLRQSPTD